VRHHVIAALVAASGLSALANPAPGEAARPRLLRGDQEAARSVPQSANDRLIIVRDLIAARELERAEQELAALTTAFPDVAAVHVHAASLSFVRNDLAGARASLERAQSLEPDSIEVLTGLIALDLRTGNLAGARTRIEQQLAKGATPALLVLASQTYVAAKDLDGAERVLREALQLDPSLLAPYELLGRLYLAQRRLDAARAEFEALATRQEKPVSALTMSGIILLTQGRTAEARKRFEEVLAIDPNAVIAANNMAWMLAESGDDLDTALRLAQTASSQAPDNPEIMDTLGWVYYKKGLFDLAIVQFQRSVEKAPDNTAYHHHLGLAYLKAGDIDRGRASLERALRTADTATAQTIRRELAQAPAAAPQR
jgi:Tfp pilus assembly protein PilF